MPETVVKDQDSALAEFSMAITKANIKDGVMRWRSVNSDIDEDYYGERMSRELFDDFKQHIESNDCIPAPFDSVIAEPDWNGGMPYLSLAHYKSGEGLINVPGAVEKVFTDGKALKSVGTFHDTPLGRAVYKSLSKDLVEKREDKIRISIGFLDLEHSHGDKYTFTRKSLTDKCPLCKEGVGDKIYKKGHLVHLALTRVPANPRTDMEVEKSMTTKMEDAKSIIEDEEVIKGLDLKSQAEDVLVMKSDEPVVERTENTSVSAMAASPVDEMTIINIPADAPVYITDASGLAQNNAVVEPAPLEKSLAALTSKVAVLKSQGLTGDEALQQIQSDYEAVGEVIRAEFTPKPTPEQVANQNLEATLRSLLGEMIPQMLAQTVAPIQAKQAEQDTVLSELRASTLVSKAVPPKKEEAIPQPRSLSLVQRTAIENVAEKVSSFRSAARASTGLQ